MRVCVDHHFALLRNACLPRALRFFSSHSVVRVPASRPRVARSRQLPMLIHPLVVYMRFWPSSDHSITILTPSLSEELSCNHIQWRHLVNSSRRFISLEMRLHTAKGPRSLRDACSYHVSCILKYLSLAMRTLNPSGLSWKTGAARSRRTLLPLRIKIQSKC